MVVSSSPLYSEQDVLAVLRLYQEWGVDDVMEDVPWDIWQNPSIQPAPLVEARARSGAASAPVGKRKGTVQLSDALGAVAQAQDAESLIRASRTIPGITLARTATHHLAPHVVEDAPFLLVGDVPNEDEDRYGTLFAGEMGIVLDRLLASIGLKREDLSIVPAIPWRPPGGQRASQRELELCLPVLHRAVALAKPQHIVTMGATAAWMMLQQEARLSQLRGRWHEVTIPGIAESIPLLPLWHPAQLGDNAGRRRHLWADLLLLEETLAKHKECKD